MSSHTAPSRLAITRLLASHAAQASFASLPDNVRTETARAFLNWMGCALGGCREPAVKMASATVAQLGGGPQASIIGHAQRTDVASAAFVNCISSSILAFDDAHLATACDIATHHHERWDGTGYPEGRPSSEFHLATRIVSVIDVFDALISRRPYKEPWDPDDAAREVEKGAGTQFDPAVVQAMLSLYRQGRFDAIILAAR